MLIGVAAHPISINPAADARAAGIYARLGHLWLMQRDKDPRVEEISQEIELHKAKLTVEGRSLPRTAEDAFTMSEFLLKGNN